MEQARKLGLNATTLSYLTGETKTVSIQVTSTSRSIERLYDQLGTRVGAGLHEKLWRRIRAEDNTVDGDGARLQVIACLADVGTVNQLESAARDRFDEWISEYRTAIDELPEAERQDFDRLQEHADAPSDRALVLPLTVRSRRTSRSIDWPQHLYRDSTGEYPDTLNEWEKDVVEGQLSDTNLICWVRNRERQSWALAIPYDDGSGGSSAMNPDFLFFRRAKGKVVVDVIDPHGLHLDDAPAKARGLAAYAERFGTRFGRFEMVIYDKVTGRKQALNLKTAATRRRVAGVTSTQHLADLFDLAGT